MRPQDEITCREFVELVTDYFEGTLAPQTLAHTEEHLVMCDWCATYAAQMRATVDAVREAEHDHDQSPAPALLAALQKRREGGA